MNEGSWRDRPDFDPGRLSDLFRAAMYDWARYAELFGMPDPIDLYPDVAYRLDDIDREFYLDGQGD